MKKTPKTKPPWETALRQWRPRPPSPDIEKRLFGDPHDRIADAAPRRSAAPGWLISCLGAASVLAVSLHGPDRRARLTPASATNAVLSPKAIVAYAAALHETPLVRRNRVAPFTFESTNSGPIFSSMGSLAP